MVAPFEAVVLALAALLVACGSAPSADQKVVPADASVAIGAAGGGAVLGPPGASAAPAPLTEEELQRLLDALEQELEQR